MRLLKFKARISPIVKATASMSCMLVKRPPMPSRRAAPESVTLLILASAIG